MNKCLIMVCWIEIFFEIKIISIRFVLELHWLENNPLIKQLTTSKNKSFVLFDY
jgi:hypothetical protein